MHSDAVFSLGICGLGLIGRRRLQAAIDFGIESSAICVFDPKLSSTASGFNGDIHFCESFEDFAEARPEKVVIATPHVHTLELATRMLTNGAEVLIEKPMGRNLQEATALYQHQNSSNLRIGFNFRFMAGVEQVKKMLDQQELGQLISISMELGHGGAPSDKDSWKLNLAAAGGGALLDPGIHLIDLLSYLFADGATIQLEIDGGNTWSGFWQTGVEESVKLLGRVNGIPFSLSISIVAWRTRFKIEIIGVEKYVILNGRGRTDGPQTLIVGDRWGWQRAKSQQDSERIFTTMEKDDSIEKETKAWLQRSGLVVDAATGLLAMKFHSELMKIIDT
jgi:predicted dehydrogenase